MPEENNDTDVNASADDQAGTTGASEKTFTQSDLDRVVQDRLSRERQKFADYDDVKAKASRFDELEAANQSELEKAQARADAAEKSAAEALQRVKESTLESKLTAAATAAGALDVEAVLKLIDHNAVTIGDDGQVTGADEAVKALLESKPYLVGKSQERNGDFDAGTRGSDSSKVKQLTRDALSKMSSEEIDEARRSGALNELMGIGTP